MYIYVTFVDQILYHLFIQARTTCICSYKKWDRVCFWEDMEGSVFCMYTTTHLSKRSTVSECIDFPWPYRSHSRSQEHMCMKKIQNFKSKVCVSG